jgi:hypothetical protein
MHEKPLGFDHMHKNKTYFFMLFEIREFLIFLCFLKFQREIRYFNIGFIFYSVCL